MATCNECGKPVTFLKMVAGHCPDCHERWLKKREEPAARSSSSAAATHDKKISAVLLTTEAQTDLEILERIDIVTAECAYGMNIFRDLFAGVRDIIGGRSEAVQKTMRDARKTVLFELRREAHIVGANAVVGVDLDYVELSGAGNMVMLVASGTAVRIRENET